MSRNDRLFKIPVISVPYTPMTEAVKRFVLYQPSTIISPPAKALGLNNGVSGWYRLATSLINKFLTIFCKFNFSFLESLEQ